MKKNAFSDRHQGIKNRYYIDDLNLYLLGDRAPPPLQPEPELLPFEDQGGEMGDLGEELECDPGEVILICAQLLARLSSLGVLSTVILKFGYSEKSTKLKKKIFHLKIDTTQ